jgi:hypothetical protein
MRGIQLFTQLSPFLNTGVTRRRFIVSSVFAPKQAPQNHDTTMKHMKDTIRTWLRTAALASAVGAGSPALADTIQITTNLTGNVTWHNTNDYVLNGFIHVLTNSVLNIEPGTVVRGKAGTGLSSSALFITQGAKIFANGTRAKPIIFCSENDDLTDPEDIQLWQRGLWGGLVIYGKSVLNTSSDASGNAASPKYDTFEGLPDTVVDGQHLDRFGGNDDDDNSGVLRYISIRNSSTVILPNKEINGLSLCAVGRGTTIENIEVVGAADDSIEFFGGTVNTKYIASFFSDDDNFDIDQGYRGKNQFWFVLQAPDAHDNGGEWNGEPSGLGTGNAPIMNFELYNATYIGAGTNATAAQTRAILSRVYAAPKVFNSIFTDFGADILNIDATSGQHFTNGVAKIQNNIWWNLRPDGSQIYPATNGTGYWVITNAANNNLVANPLLRGIQRTNSPAFGLDPRPLPGSPALTNSSNPAPNDGFYTPVTYSGAFDTSDLWLADWTFASQVGLIQHRPEVDDAVHTVQVTANLSGTNNWYRTNTYVLNGFIHVLTNSVLNIEPGTVVRGKAGTGLSSSALFITQGAKIFANGTAHSPIIFCSENDDLTDPEDIQLWQRGLWGGLVIYGKSVLNTSSDASGNAASPKYDTFEGLPDTVVDGQHLDRFGGNDDDDNSGVLRYISIRNSSTVILPNKEINGLSLCAVGRGTTIENIEVVGAADDSIEFFGGTVNTKYIASFFSDDDNFDIDQGYRGKNQFWFVLQAPDAHDNGGEWNGEPSGLGTGNAPIMNFELYNATYIGAGTNATAAQTRAILSRVYAAPKVFNSIFTDFGADILNIDATSGQHFTNGLAKIQNNIWWNLRPDGSQIYPATNGTGYWVITNAANNNLVANPLLRGIQRTNAPAFGLDPRPLPGSPALTNSSNPAPNDGFYTPVTYSGAFKDVNWASDWGYAAETGLITGAGAGTPRSPVTAPAVPNQPVLSTGTSGGNLHVSFPTQIGFSYQLQSADSLPAGTWADEGTSITGSGGMVTNSIPISGAAKFFRVRAQ